MVANDLSACHRHLLRSDVASANLEMLRHISSSRVCNYYEGLGTRAIASLLETTDDAVRQRLSRARVSLRKALKGGFDDFSA